MKTYSQLPEPVDVFPARTPVRNTPEWQLRRLNRIATVLWESRGALGDDDRIAISVDPDQGTTQITVHVHAPADLDVAQRLVDRLQWDPEADRRRSGMRHLHYWHGMIGGFRASVVWVEEPAAGDTQGRDPLPVGVGTGMAGRIEPVIGPEAKPWSAATAEALAPSEIEHEIQQVGRGRSAGAQRLVELVAPIECDNQTGQPVKFLAPDGRWYLSLPDGSAPTLIAEGPGQ